MYTIQSNFTKGEIDPQATARIDLNQYYQGLELARNVLCVPQGGMRKRGGMEYLEETENVSARRLETFSFSTEENYIVLFRNNNIDFYALDGTLVDTVSAPYTGSDIDELDYIQSYNTIIITNENYRPRRIVRSSTNNFTIGNVPLTNLPQNNFNDISSPAGVAEIQRIRFFDDSAWATGDTFTLTFNGIQTDPIVYLRDDTVTNQQQTAKNIQDALNLLPNLQGDGVSVVYVDSTSSGQYDVTFAPTTADDWGLMTGLVESATGNIANNGIDIVRIQDGVSTFEDSWSSSRGWPATCTFHEGRLWFGGSRSLPSTLWGSNVNDFFNFRSYKARDDESITATLDTDQRNAITAIYSNRALQVFTTGQEFYVPSSPITPENISVNSQTNFGSKRVRPITLSGQTLFIQDTGRSLNSFVFSEDQQANITSSISILAPHLIKNPRKIDIQRGTQDTDANYIYMVNDDNTVTVLNSLPFENIDSFTRWETNGEIISVTVAADDVFFIVERFGARFLEKAVRNRNLDGYTLKTGAHTSVSGLDRFEGQEVSIKADGYVLEPQIVAGGQVALPRVSQETEVGLLYLPEVVTLPFNVQLQTGSALYKKKKIKRVALDLFESNGIVVNGSRLADKTLGVNQFDPPQPYTGIRRRYLQGWGLERRITITQTTPYSMQVLSIGVEIAL